MSWTKAVDWIALSVDAIGVLTILTGFVAAFLRNRAILRGDWEQAYRQLRQDVGRGILLGLEFLVAADIIRTVAVAPTLESVSVLGIIVLIRTFLSMSLQVELEGHWPWQKARMESRQE